MHSGIGGGLSTPCACEMYLRGGPAFSRAQIGNDAEDYACASGNRRGQQGEFGGGEVFLEVDGTDSAGDLLPVDEHAR